MSDTAVNKKLNWDLGIDLDDFKRDMGSVASEVKGVATAILDFGRKADQGVKQTQAEFRQLGQGIRQDLLDAVNTLGNGWKKTRTEVKGVGQEINQVLTSTRNQLAETQKLIRQTGMTEWQKQADNYGAAIRKARNDVNELTKALKNASLEDNERNAAVQRLAEAQKNLNKLQAASKSHVALGIDAGAEKVLDNIKSKLDAIANVTRQHGMNVWEQEADHYAGQIVEAKKQVDALKQSLSQANIPHKETIAIQAKIAQGEAQIIQLVDAARQRVDQVKQAELGRAAATKQAAEAEAQAASAKAQHGSVNQFSSSLKGQIDSIGTAIRQAGMNEWQKLADGYGQSIGKAHVQVNALRQALASANVTDKERLAIEQKIIEAERQIGQLTQQSAKHVDQVRQQEKERLSVVKATSHEIRQAMQDLGLMAGIAGAAITGGLAMMGKEFADFDASLRTFRAVSSGSVEDMNAFKQTALELGQTSGITAKEVAAAGVELVKMGFSSKEASVAITGMIDASIASGESLQTTSEIIAGIVRQFGMAVSDTGRVGDLVTKAANASSISIKDIGESMRYLGSAAHGADQSMEDMAALLVVVGNELVKGTVSGTGFKDALHRLEAPAKQGREELERFHLSIKNSTGGMRPFLDIILDLQKAMAGMDKVDQNKSLKKIFGEVALTDMQVLFNKSAKEIRAAQADMHDYSDTAKNTADIIREGPAQAIKELNGAFETLKLTIGEDVMGVFVDLLHGVKDLIGVFLSLDPTVRKVGVAVTGVAGLVFTAFAGAAGISVVVGKGAEAFKLLASNMLTKVVPAAVTTGEAITGVGVAADTAAVGGLTVFGTAIAALVVGGAAIWILLKAVKDLDDAYKGLDDSMNVFAEVRSYSAGQLEHANGILSKGGKLTSDEARKAASDASNLINENTEKLDKLKTVLPELEKMRREMANPDWKTQANVSMGVDVRPGKIAELERQLQEAGFTDLRSGALRAQLVEISNKLLTLDQQRGKLVKMAGDMTQAERVKAAADKEAASAQVQQIQTGKIRLDQMDSELKKQLDLNKQRQIDRDADIQHKQEMSRGGGVAGSARNTYETFLGNQPITRIRGVGGNHAGVDLQAKNDFEKQYGSMVYAPENMRVTGVNASLPYGAEVVLQSLVDKRVTYILHHLSPGDVRNKIQVGQEFGSGDPLGVRVGGKAEISVGEHWKGVHLHVEKYINGLLDSIDNDKGRTSTLKAGGAGDPKQSLLASEVLRMQDDLKVLQALRAKLSETMQGMGDDQAKEKAAAQKKLDALDKQITSTQQALQKKGFDLQKAAFDEQRKAIRDKLQDMQKDFAEYVKASTKAAEEGKKFFYDALDPKKAKELTADKALNIQAEMEKQILDAEDKLQQMRDAYAEKSKDTARMGPEELKVLKATKEQIDKQADSVGRLVYQYEHLTGTKIHGMKTLPSGIRVHGIDSVGVGSLNIAAGGEAGVQKFEDVAKMAEKGMAFVQKLRENQDALDEFSTALKGDAIDVVHLGEALGYSGQQLREMGIKADNLGRVPLDFLMTQVGLTEKQLKSLFNDISFNKGMQSWQEDIDNTRIWLKQLEGSIDNVKEGILAGANGDETWMNSLGDQIQNSLGLASQFNNMIQQFGGNASTAFNDIGTAVVGVGSGLSKMLKGDFSGAFDVIGSLLTMTLSLVNRNKQAAMEYRQELEKIKLLTVDDETRSKQQAYDDAKNSGASNNDLVSKGSDLALSKAKGALAKILNQAHQPDQLGLDFVIDSKNGAPDFGEAVDRYQKAIDGLIARGKKEGDKELAGMQRTLVLLKNFKSQVADTFDQLKADLLNNSKQATGTITDTLTQEQKAVQDYMRKAFDEPAADEALKKKWMESLHLPMSDEGMTEEMQTSLNTIGDNYVKGVREIQKDIAQNLRGKPIDVDWSNLGALPEDVRNAFWDRYIGMYKGVQDQIDDALKKTGQKAAADLTKTLADAQTKLEKDLKDSEDKLKKNADALKKARTNMLDVDTQKIQDLIDAEQRRLDILNEQNKAFQQQIKDKQDLLNQDLKAFESQDQGSFAGMVGSVNYLDELRKGLGDIHNPDGVLTDTYSLKSQQDAMKEHLDLLRMQNENKLGLEQYDSSDPAKNKALYQAERQRIDAIEARFAQEQLQRTGLTNRQITELEAQKNQAYLDYKTSHAEALREATEFEVTQIQTQIDINAKKAETIQAGIDLQKKGIDGLKAEWEKDTKFIDEQVALFSQANDAMVFSVDALRNGVEGPLKSVISLYQQLNAAAQGSYSSTPGVVSEDNVYHPNISSRTDTFRFQGADGQWYNSQAGADAARAAYTPYVQNVPGMATGGIVPPGFPSDSYPALLSSGEMVIPGPTPLQDVFSRMVNSWYPQMPASSMSSYYRGNTVVNIYDTQNPAQMKQIVMEVLHDKADSGAHVNAAFNGTLN